MSPSGPYTEADDPPVEVEVRVTPWYPSYYWDEWEGDCASLTAYPCEVTMDGDKSVTAVLVEDCDPNFGCRSSSDGVRTST